MEATREACKMAIDDTSMPQWYRDAMAELAAKESPAAAPAAQPAQPPALSADDIAERVRHLTNLGISPAAASIYANPERLAAQQRMERRRDIATRLGVKPEFLPEGFEDAD